MSKIHIILQGKGGVGKSLISSLIAQYHYENKDNELPLCIDTDPVNATFTGYKKLNVKMVQVLEGDEIDSRNFDSLIELISGCNSNVIIDNGASTFVPLAHYMLSNEVPELLRTLEHELIIHTVVTGGQALTDTVNGFAQLAKQFDHVKIVVWLNPYWGVIEYEGRGFEQLKAYKDNKDRVTAIISLPTLKKETFGRDLSDLLSERMTFNEALESEGLSIMAKQRLKIVKYKIFENMKSSGVF